SPVRGARKSPAIGRAFSFLRLTEGRARSAPGTEGDGAARGDRLRDRLEAPAADRRDRFAVEHPRRVGAHHARVADAAVRRDGEFDLHLSRLRGAQRIGGIARGRRAERTQRRRGGRGRGGWRRGRLLGLALLGGTLFGGALLRGDALGCHARRGVTLGGARLFGELFGGDALLVGLGLFAFGGELALVFGLLLGAERLLHDALL